MDPIDLFLHYEKEVAQFKLQVIRRLEHTATGGESPSKTRTSQIQIVENVLAAAGRPLHVADIIEAAQRDFGVTLERDSVSSALAKQIRKGTRFVRTGPNTFGLRPT